MTAMAQASPMTLKLCPLCAEMDFESLLPDKIINCHQLRRPDGSFSQKRDPYHGELNEDLGTLMQVFERIGRCEFCRLVIKVIQKHLGTTELPTHIESHQIHCNVVQSKIGRLDASNASSKERFILTRFKIIGQTIKDYARGLSNPLFSFEVPFAIHIGSKGGDSCLSHSHSTYIGRYRPKRCDPVLIRKWVRACDNNHEECLDIARSKTHIECIRLIDVDRLCVRTFLNDAIPRYIALSYVWGCGLMFQGLTKANLPHLHLPGGLKTLPKTITDAIEVTKQLGERWLWVDTLCIIQDDETDKITQIDRMGDLYGGSYLTLIAASGASADTGLPGISRDRPEQLWADLEEFRLYSTTAPIEPFKGSQILNTIWNSRGWTFQEKLLSKRCLIFLEGQIYWECRQKECFEDLDVDAPDCILTWGNGLPGKLELSVNYFGQLIEAYTSRSLTFDDDIFNAFTGIMTAIPDEFFFGVPTSKFVYYLCWDLSWDCKDNEKLQRRSSPQAPSWSWLAWKGHIGMNYSGSAPESLVTCFRFLADALVPITQQIAPNSLALDQTILVDEIASHIKLTNEHIVFRAVIAKLRLRQSHSHYFDICLPVAPRRLAYTSKDGKFSYYKYDSGNSNISYGDDGSKIGHLRAVAGSRPQDGSLHDFVAIASHGWDDLLSYCFRGTAVWHTENWWAPSLNAVGRRRIGKRDLSSWVR